MILLEKTKVVGFEEAIRGMRNPMNSWGKSDSSLSMDPDDYVALVVDGEKGYYDIPRFTVGPDDLALMRKLAKGGAVHAKYRRMIAVYVDVTAPLYWWKEFDTYKVGTVANSCSTMHKIHAKEFTLDDFSHEHLLTNGLYGMNHIADSSGTEQSFATSSIAILRTLCGILNTYRSRFLKTKDKIYWWQMIQLLPSSYNQKRTLMLNYEVLAGLYPQRREHKLDEWRYFCKWVEGLPYSEVITLGGGTDG